MKDVHDRNTTPELLRMLNHTHHTQGVEAMNNSIASYAPKGRTFSGTMSLNTRVEIACSVHNIGHFETWSLIYTSFGVDIPFSLSKLYKSRDRATIRIRNRQQTRGYKIKRKKKDHDKFYSERQRQKADLKAGLTYESGIALADAKRRVKELDKKRNPAGTPNDEMVCPYYHPLFCNVKGHTSMASAQ